MFLLYGIICICIDVYIVIFKFNAMIDEFRTMAVKSVLICLLNPVCIFDLWF
jgi:hypothetical protein